MANKIKKRRVRVLSFSNTQGHAVIAGLTHKEVDALVRAFDEGECWVKAKKSKDGIMIHPVSKPLPDPVEDEDMLPFWRKGVLASNPRQLELFSSADCTVDGGECRIKSYYIVRGLGSFWYSPSLYRREARKLKSYGFVCMRSQRGDDGKFSEIWCLTDTQKSKGALREVIVQARNDYALEHENVLKFLHENVVLGCAEAVATRIVFPAEWLFP